jgi:DNA (cytosine-5)-methyltransferase 1
MIMQTIIRFFDLFSGAGGCRAGLELAGGYECAGYCEKDKHAVRAYRSLFDIKESEVFYEDATRIDPKTLPEFDLLIASFPNPSVYGAGEQHELLGACNAMLPAVTRLVGAARPQYLLFETIPRLLSLDGGRTFAAFLAALSGLRYNLELQSLNSAAFGVAQARKRVFIIGYFGSGCAGAVLPLIGADRAPVVQTVRPTDFAPLLIKEATKRGYKEAYPGDSVDIGYVDNHTRRGRVGRGIAHTLNASRMQGVVMPDGRIRRLMPRECFRLQGFSDSQIDKLLENTSDPQAYTLAGNATTVNVVYALAKRLKTAHEAAVAATEGEELPMAA